MTEPRVAALGAIAGVPQSVLAPELLARVEAIELSPAPWDCRCQAIFWVGRGSRAAAAAIDPSLGRRGPTLSVVGGMLRYLNTPVGGYDEVFGGVVFAAGRRLRTNVPFMSVDLVASIAGGRGNWSLPKSLASFDGSPTSTMTARGERWQVNTCARTFGPPFPLRMNQTLRQVWPDGCIREAQLRLAGSARLAVISVAVSADDSLRGWLRPGRHLGVAFEQASFRLDSAQ